MKDEVNKLDNNELYVATNFNNLKTKVYDLDVVELKTIAVDLKKKKKKKIIDIVSKEVVKKCTTK